MKTKIIFAAAMTAALCAPQTATAAVTTVCELGGNKIGQDTCNTGSPHDMKFAIAQNCKTQLYYTFTGKYGFDCVPYCASCPSGYKLATDKCTITDSIGNCEIIGSVVQLPNISHLCGTLIVPTCVIDYQAECKKGEYGTAPNCKDCPSNANCPGGNGSTFYCNKGYYKNDSTCSRCPSSGGVYGTTSGTGATAITQCYLPVGTTGSDSTGSFTYTGNCYYSN